MIELKGPDLIWSHVHLNDEKIYEDSPATPSRKRLKTDISHQKWLLEDSSFLLRVVTFQGCISWQ